MGLDMYLRGISSSPYPSSDPVDTYGKEETALGYWRKHPDLHGYIIQQFAKGVDECQGVELTADDIKKTISAIRRKKLPSTSGFFFGQSYSADDQDSIKQLQFALAWLQAGERLHRTRKLIYQASW